MRRWTWMGLLALALGGCPGDQDDDVADDDATGDDDTGDDDSADDDATGDDDDTTYAGPWEQLADLPTGGAWPAAAVVDGAIHVIPSNDTAHYVYVTDADEWSEAAGSPEAAHYHAAEAWGGKLYLMGGGSPTAIDSLDSLRGYDPGTDAWTALSPMPTARGYLVARELGGDIYAIGGPRVSGEIFHLTMEAYDPDSDTWRTAPQLPPDTSWALYSAVVVVDGLLYKLAGGIANGPEDGADVFDPGTGQWTALTATPRPNHGLAGAAIGRTIYLTGGYYDWGYSTEVVLYDIDSDSYSDGPPLPAERAYSSMVSLDGCVYVIGGHHDIHPDEVGVSVVRLCE